jgi:methylmalonyl-CoA/ethylmalonyl-CoA epimerase
VGIAVRDLDAAKARWAALGYRPVAEGTVAEGTVPEQGVRVAMLEGDAGARLELLAPTGPETPVGRFLAKRGEGLHHLAFAVPDVAAALAGLKAAGARLIDEAPRPGFGGHRVAFVHPRAFAGVLVELVEE